MVKYGYKYFTQKFYLIGYICVKLIFLYKDIKI